MLDDSNGVATSPSKKVSVTLSANDKWRLVKPLLGRYMLSLCTFFKPLELGFWILAVFLFSVSTSHSVASTTSLANQPFVLVCVYLVCTPLDIGVRVRCGFEFRCLFLVGIPISNIRPIRLVFATNLFTIQVISPTLLYRVSTRVESWLLSKIIPSVSDYYPLWQVCFFF